MDVRRAHIHQHQECTPQADHIVGYPDRILAAAQVCPCAGCARCGSIQLRRQSGRIHRQDAHPEPHPHTGQVRQRRTSQRSAGNRDRDAGDADRRLCQDRDAQRLQEDVEHAPRLVADARCRSAVGPCVPYQQIIVVQFFRPCRRSIFHGDVRPVLLDHRCERLEKVDQVLRGGRIELHRHLLHQQDGPGVGDQMVLLRWYHRTSAGKRA